MYVVTAQPPAAVTHSSLAHFTGPDVTNLIIVKCTRLEVHTLSEHDGLVPVLDVGLYGRVATMEVFRPPEEEQDLIFLTTERYQFCVLRYDAAKRQITTKAQGELRNRIGRATDSGPIGGVDPGCRMLGLHLYDGLFKAIPIGHHGSMKDAFDIRLEELQVSARGPSEEGWERVRER